ncbi:MAG TPA: zinc-dependent metalloprotease family protein, partial [Flavobacterium sp.]|nr:zinc-dependent metalloprotease family protein [Flavobacterium sp.]
MKNKLLTIALVAITSMSFAQTGSWKLATVKGGTATFQNKADIQSPKLFELNINALRQSVQNAPQRFSATKNGPVVAFPNADGQFDNFRIEEFSNMDPELAARYPEIKSYVGQSIENPASTIYFSISPLGLQTMTIQGDRSAIFIEPYTTDLSTYVVYRKSDKVASLNKFECKVIAGAHHDLDSNDMLRPNADDGLLRNYRLAMSVTGEYTAYFGGTKALALAAINNSMTRVNGVFEKDFGVHMNLIANTDAVIYTSGSTDPYSAASTGAGGAWNQELQTTLTNVIGSANYDIGHLFGASGGGGNAGCIGCVCKNPTSSAPLGKGSGYTSPGDGIPQGDNFDIDYVAHEIGHQFGANHTFTHSNEGTGAQMEPGSGSTIMGYAGITGATNDVQPHSDAYFHAMSIQQITNYIKTTTCQTSVATGNAVPTANAGLDYTIPKGTPFILTGSATDANGDVLTYDWEQMNVGTPTSTIPSATRTTGPAFRSILPSTSPSRYFPQLSTVKTGATSWKWEVVPTVARTMNFRMTVRDNRAGGPANNSDDMIVTVNGTAGPFTVSAPNTAVSWAGGSTQTVTWNVAGTTANGVNASNVTILMSTDGGNTYPVTL